MHRLNSAGSTYLMSPSTLSRRPTLTYTSSLCEHAQVKFRIGNEVLCMTWNIHHDVECTPFDFYCDFRNLSLKERDAVSIEILWDVARVFFYPDAPSSVCTSTTLKQLVPPFLLTKDALENYCAAADLDEKEAKEVMGYPDASLHKLLTSHSVLEDISNKRNKDSTFIKIHRKSDRRASSPLRPGYDPSALETLLKDDPSLLPVLILDSLHVLVIRFSQFLIDNQLRKAFSEFEPDEQTARVADFLNANKPQDLELPQPFTETRARLYDKWKTVFQNVNKIRQISNKVSEQTMTDIVLLQRVVNGAFTELQKQLSEDFRIIPEKFPADQPETTVVLLRRSTVDCSSKERRLDAQNFAVLAKVAGINFNIGVTSFTPGEGCSSIRKKEAAAMVKILGKSHPSIIGGLFNEDLTAFDNPVAQILLRKLNGIDHTQEEPLAFSVNRTRTNLQFEITKADKQDKGVQDGIFSTFPLVGEAFTDFQHSGLENPSDHGPVFQRILVQT